MEQKEAGSEIYGKVIVGWFLFGIGFAILFGVFGGLMAGGTAFMLSFGAISALLGGVINCLFIKFKLIRKSEIDTMNTVGWTAFILFFGFIALGIFSTFNYT